MPYKSISAQRAASRDHYHRNRTAYISRAKAHTASVKRTVRAFILGYLTGHPCIDCGEADPVVLEFDHRDRADKKFNIGDAVHRGYSLCKVRAEIDKCDVRCANCHRRKTWREQQVMARSEDDKDLAELPLFR